MKLEHVVTPVLDVACEISGPVDAPAVVLLHGFPYDPRCFDGVVPIRDLNRAMNWDLPDEEAVTVAGLVIHEAQAIPDPGQRFAFHGYRFQVLRRNRNQITALRVEKEEPVEEVG